MGTPGLGRCRTDSEYDLKGKYWNDCCNGSAEPPRGGSRHAAMDCGETQHQVATPYR